MGTIMKLSLLGGTALLAVLAMAGAAEAADVSAPSYDWSGFYAGVNAGALFDNSNVNSDLSGNADWIVNGNNWQDRGDVGFTGGGILGYNWQLDRVVLGLEADLNYGDLSGAGGSSHDGVVSGANYESNWFGTVRGRAGYAFDNVLLYGTAGLAYGGMDTKNGIETVDFGYSDKVGLGWTAGGGIEYGIENWSLGVEYLYVDLGTVDANYSGVDVSGDSFKVKNETDYQANIFRATAKYRF